MKWESSDEIDFALLFSPLVSVLIILRSLTIFGFPVAPTAGLYGVVIFIFEQNTHFTTQALLCSKMYLSETQLQD